MGMMKLLENADMSSICIDAAWAGKEIGDPIEVNGKTYYYGSNAFGNVSEASAAVTSETVNFYIQTGIYAAEPELFAITLPTAVSAVGDGVVDLSSTNIVFGLEHDEATEPGAVKVADENAAVFTLTGDYAFRQLYTGKFSNTIFAIDGSISLQESLFLKAGTRTTVSEGSSIAKNADGANATDGMIAVYGQVIVNGSITFKSQAMATVMQIGHTYDAPAELLVAGAAASVTLGTSRIDAYQRKALPVKLTKDGTLRVEDGAAFSFDGEMNNEGGTVAMKDSTAHLGGLINSAGSISFSNMVSVTAAAISNAGTMTFTGTSVDLSGTYKFWEGDYSKGEVVDKAYDLKPAGSGAAGSAFVNSGNFMLSDSHLGMTGAMINTDLISLTGSSELDADVVLENSGKIVFGTAAAAYEGAYSGNIAADSLGTVQVLNGNLRLTGNITVAPKFESGKVFGFILGTRDAAEDDGRLAAVVTVVAGAVLSAKNSSWIGSADGAYETPELQSDRFKLIVDGGVMNAASNAFTIRNSGAVEVKNGGSLSAYDGNVRNYLHVTGAGSLLNFGGNVYGESPSGADGAPAFGMADISLTDGAKAVFTTLSIGGNGSGRADRRGKLLVDHAEAEAETITLQAANAGEELRAHLTLANGATLKVTSLVNAGLLTVADSALSAGTITNSSQIDVTGNGTIATTGVFAAGNLFFGGRDSAVDSSLDMTNLKGGRIRVLNGSVILTGTQADTAGVTLMVGNFWSAAADQQKYAGDYGAASGTMTIAENATVYYTQLLVGDDNHKGNTQTLKVAGTADMRDGGGTAYVKTMGVLEVTGTLNSKYLYGAGKVTVNGGTLSLGSSDGVYSAKIGTDEAPFAYLELASNATVISTKTVALGYDVNRYAWVTITGKSLLDADSLSISSGSSVEMDYTSSLAFTNAFTNAGTISVDMTGVAENGLFRLIDSKTGAMTLEAYGNVVFKGGVSNGYALTVIDNDLYAVKVDTSEIYVNSAWSGMKTGDRINVGTASDPRYVYFGFNAFAALDAATASGNLEYVDGKLTVKKDRLYGDLTGLTGVDVQAGTGLFGNLTLTGGEIAVNGEFRGNMELGAGSVIAVGKDAILGLGSRYSIFHANGNSGPVHFTELGGSAVMNGSSKLSGPLTFAELNGGKVIIDSLSGSISIDSTGHSFFTAGFLCNASNSPSMEIGSYSGSIVVSGPMPAYGFYVGADGWSISSAPLGTAAFSVDSFSGILSVSATDGAAYGVSVYCRENAQLTIREAAAGSEIKVSGLNNAYGFRNASTDSGSANMTISDFAGEIQVNLAGAANPGSQQSAFGIYNYSRAVAGVLTISNFTGTISVSGQGTFQSVSSSGKVYNPMLVGVYNAAGSAAITDFSGTLSVRQQINDPLVGSLYGFYGNKSTFTNFSGSVIVNRMTSQEVKSIAVFGIYGTNLTLKNFTGTVFAGNYAGDDLDAQIQNMKDPAKAGEAYAKLAPAVKSAYAVYAAGGDNTVEFNAGTLIFGSVVFGAGNDQLTITGGTIVGRLKGGTGTDSLTFGTADAGYTGSLFGIDGFESVAFKGGSSITVVDATATSFTGSISIDVKADQIGDVYTVVSGKLTYSGVAFTVNGKVVDNHSLVQIGDRCFEFSYSGASISLSAVTVPTDQLRVNSAWSALETGTRINIGTEQEPQYVYYGYNAFATVDSAMIRSVYTTGITLEITGSVGSVLPVKAAVTEVNTSARPANLGDNDVIGVDALVVNMNGVDNTAAGWAVYSALAANSVARVYGNVVTNFNSGTFTYDGKTSDPVFVGGAYSGASSRIYGNTEVRIGVTGAADSEVSMTTGSIIGAGAGTVNGDSTVNIYSGVVNAGSSIVGGGSWDGVVKGNSTVNIFGGTVTAATDDANEKRGIMGGGYYGAVTEGNSAVNVSGASTVVNSRIYGGGSKNGDKAATVRGNASVTVSDATVNGNIYGGGFNSIVEGDTTITLSNATVNGDIFAGGNGAEAVVGGNAAVNISGGVCTGNVSGAGVSGSSSLTVSSGSIGGDITGFNSVTLGCALTMTVGKGIAMTDADDVLKIDAVFKATTISLGAGNDCMAICKAVTVDDLDFGTGDDSITLKNGTSIIINGTLSFKGTLTVSGSGTIYALNMNREDLASIVFADGSTVQIITGNGMLPDGEVVIVNPEKNGDHVTVDATVSGNLVTGGVANDTGDVTVNSSGTADELNSVYGDLTASAGDVVLNNSNAVTTNVTGNIEASNEARIVNQNGGSVQIQGTITADTVTIQNQDCTAGCGSLVLKDQIVAGSAVNIVNENSNRISGGMVDGTEVAAKISVGGTGTATIANKGDLLVDIEGHTVEIENDGHLNANIVADTITIRKNTSANTLTGTMTGNVIDVTNDDAGAVRDWVGTAAVSLTFVNNGLIENSTFASDDIRLSGSGSYHNIKVLCNGTSTLVLNSGDFTLAADSVIASDMAIGTVGGTTARFGVTGLTAASGMANYTGTFDGAFGSGSYADFELDGTGAVDFKGSVRNVGKFSVAGGLTLTLAGSSYLLNGLDVAGGLNWDRTSGQSAVGRADGAGRVAVTGNGWIDFRQAGEYDMNELDVTGFAGVAKVGANSVLTMDDATEYFKKINLDGGSVKLNVTGQTTTLTGNGRASLGADNTVNLDGFNGMFDIASGKILRLDGKGYMVGNVFANDGEMHSVAGGTTLVLENSSHTGNCRVYTAGYVTNNSVARIAGDVTLTIGSNFSAETQCNLYGAGRVESNALLRIDGDVNVNLAAGSTFGSVFGGGVIASGNASHLQIGGAVRMTISGGEFNGFVGTGTQALTGTVTIGGGTSMAISGGTFKSFVFAGGYSQGGASIVKGGCQLTIDGGTFNGTIFGGSLADTKANSGNSLITGDINITVDTSGSKQVTINDHMYAGSYGHGAVNGNTSVTFSGLGSNLIFGADSVVVGDSQLIENGRNVTGTKTLQFADFSGEFNAGITHFSDFKITGVSSVNLVRGAGDTTNLSCIENWEFTLSAAAEPLLTWLDGKNNFADDSMTLHFDSSTGSKVLIDSDHMGVFNGWEKLASVDMVIDSTHVQATWDAVENGWLGAYGGDTWKLAVDETNKDLMLSKLA